MKQRQKTNLSSDSKSIEKQTILSKTASAVRNKYNSIITTRRNSNISSSVENSPVKGGTTSIILKISSVPEDTKNMSESVFSHVDAKSASNILLKLKTRLQDKVIETIDLKSEENSQMLSSDNQNENAVDKVESKGDDDNVLIKGNKDVKTKTDDISVKTRSRSDKKISMVDNIQSKINKIIEDDEKEESVDDSSEKKGKLDEKTGLDQSFKSEVQRSFVEQKEEIVKSEIKTDDENVKNSPVEEGNVENSPVEEVDKVKVEDKLTPSKKDYLSKLQETIKKGKENLGITDENDELDEDESSSEEDDDDDDDDDDDEEEETEDDEEEEDVEINDEKEDSENIVNKSSGESECAQEKSLAAVASTINQNENCNIKNDQNSSSEKHSDDQESYNKKHSDDQESYNKKHSDDQELYNKKHSDDKESSDEKGDKCGTNSKTVIEREYKTVVKDVLDETTGEITKVKEAIQPEPMDIPEVETCLMMEVETESDTDKLVIDTDDDRTLSPSPHKSKVLLPSSRLKPKTNDVLSPPVTDEKSVMIECAPVSPIINR
jgi:hypothetical protein